MRFAYVGVRLYYKIVEDLGIAFGPVPSRRLGRSLGVNNIPPKFCTYSCIYCQVGKTLNMTSNRQVFYDPLMIFNEVKEKVERCATTGETIDYVTFVPQGEPTLDVNLGAEVQLIKSLGVKVAIITNGSLLWKEDVKRDLLHFDLVSVKVDAVSEALWRRINRPFKDLALEKILEGIREFSELFSGTLITETMLVDGIDYGEEFQKIADFLQSLSRLRVSYISVPTRPPAEEWVKPPKEEVLVSAFEEFSKKLGNRVEYLIGYEGDAFSTSGDVVKDILSITAVHPMREDAVKALFDKAGEDFGVLNRLLENGSIKRVYYEGKAYYVRNYKRNVS